MLGIAWLVARPSLEDLWLRWRPGAWVLPLGVGYSVALRLLIAVVAAMIAAALVVTGAVSPQKLQHASVVHRPDVDRIVDIHALQNNPGYFWLSITIVSFAVAGLREELWRGAVIGACRRLWPNTFSTRPKQLIAAGAASIIFGLGHLPQGIIAVGMTTLLGFGLGAIMILHRSIWPSVIAHGAFDATTFALLPFAYDLLRKLS
jgi:membrane protease YdiL (CAAX protease family)